MSRIGALALVLCFVLSGCLASRAPLFGPETNVYPLPSDGTYRHFHRFSDEREGPQFEDVGDVTITLQNGQYRLSRDKNHRGRKVDEFTLHALGEAGVYAAQSYVVSERGSGYVYDLIQIAPDGRILSWEVDCTFDVSDDEARVFGVDQSALPVCIVDRAEALMALFSRIRAARPHTSEYEPLSRGPASPAIGQGE